MKARVSVLLGMALLWGLAGCTNSYSPPGTTPTTTGVKTRAFISNAGFLGGGAPASLLQIVDFSKDTLLNQQVNVGPNPQAMTMASSRAVTMVFDAGNNNISLVDNATETEGAHLALPDFTESMAIQSNAATGYAAVRNAPVTGQPSGAVIVLDVTNKKIATQVAIASARFLALSPNGSKLLVFSDASNSVFVIDTASNTLEAPVSDASLDHPVSAVFSSDSNTAYVLSCGPECGGTLANVTAVNLTTNPATVSGSVAGGVPGATVGLLNGSSLYVAGTSATGGVLTVVTTPGLTKSAPLTISNGFHHVMAMTGNSKVYIGADVASFSGGTNSTCSGTPGCLSVYNIGSNSASIVAQNCSLPGQPCGAVTGLAPISGRNVVYVCEGGELHIYSTTTDTLQSTQIDIIGQAWDVVQVDP